LPLVCVAIGKCQEFLDFFLRRRHDRQAITPLVLVEEPVDLFEASLEDDIVRRRLFNRNSRITLFKQIRQNSVARHLADVFPQFL